MTTTAQSPAKSLTLPWQDRRGRLSWLKLSVFVGLFVPAIFIAGQWSAGDLMPRPLNAVIHLTGLWGMRFLLLSLCLTPLRVGLTVPEFALLRRMLGLGAFAYIAAHFLLFIGDQAFDAGAVLREIVGRFYLTIGFVALIGLCLLAATSTDGMVRRLGGPRWRRLHRITYGIGLLALVHFFMQSKADPAEATVAAGIFLWALARRRWSSPAAISGLVALAGICAALAEAGFFFALRGIDPLRVLAANLDVEYGLRPALWAGLIAAAVEIAGLIRRRAARKVPGAPRSAAPRRAESAP